MKKNHIRSLDTLRGLAALSVCLLHANPIFGVPSLMHHAYLAVDFFFALSGFILVSRYKDLILNTGGPLTFNKFAIVRFARLYPLYLLALIIGAAYVLLRLFVTNTYSSVGHQFITSFVKGIFVLPSFHTDLLSEDSPIFPFTTQAWSIFWEFVFSGLFFVLIRFGKTSFANVSAAIGFAAISIIAIKNNTVDGGWQNANFYVGGVRALFSFSIGIICVSLSNPNSINEKIKIFAGYISLTLIILYFVFSSLTNAYAELLIIGVLVPLVIVGLSNTKSSILNNKIGDWLGGISFSVYLIHGIIASVTESVLRKTTIITPSIALGIVWTAAMLAISTFIWKYFEIPAQKWLKKILH